MFLASFINVGITQENGGELRDLVLMVPRQIETTVLPQFWSSQ